MDIENLQDFTKRIRDYLREMECYDLRMFEDGGGSQARNAVTQLEKAIVTAIEMGVYEDPQRRTTIAAEADTCPMCIEWSSRIKGISQCPKCAATEVFGQV